jgi:hypothetical protein
MGSITSSLSRHDRCLRVLIVSFVHTDGSVTASRRHLSTGHGHGGGGIETGLPKDSGVTMSSIRQIPIDSI